MSSTRLLQQARGSSRCDRGFTMVEVLVALVILAIGLLGIAALYLDSLRAGRTAIYRSQAVNLAADIADRIRANRAVPLSYAVDFGDIPPAEGYVAACGAGSNCAPETVATDDLSLWKQQIHGTVDAGGDPVTLGPLPEAEGSIAVTAGTPNVYVITIRWTETGQDAPATYTLRLET